MSLIIKEINGNRVVLGFVWWRDIYEAIEQTICYAIEQCREVEFEFNGVMVVVDKNSKNDIVYRDWTRGISGYLGEKPTVGPEYHELTSEELENDHRIKAENREKQRIRDEEYKRKSEEKTRKLNEKLALAPALEVNDLWQPWLEKNQDPYGACIFRYAEKWGRLMQLEGVENADALSYEADDEGITGFMQSAATSILEQCWVHGDSLRESIRKSEMARQTKRESGVNT